MGRWPPRAGRRFRPIECRRGELREAGGVLPGEAVRPRPEKREKELVLYDSRDLVTHALCVGTTGSGKTGLCIGLIEEAAIDGIPSLLIQSEIDLSTSAADPITEKLEPLSLRPKKTDVSVRLTALVWLPHWKDASGNLSAAWQ